MKRTLSRIAVLATSIIFSVSLFFAVAPHSFADSYGLEAARNASQYKESTKSLPEIAGSMINLGLSLLGLVFLGLALYSGFKWMTAQGTEKDVTTARDTLVNATIGLVIVFSAYALTTFLFTDVVGTITGTVDPTAATEPAADPGDADPIDSSVTPGVPPEDKPLLVYCCYSKQNQLVTKLSAPTSQEAMNECKTQYPLLSYYTIESNPPGTCPYIASMP